VQKVGSCFKSLGFWEVIPMEKWFYEFAFSTIEDMRRVLAVGSWNLNLGI